MAFLLIFEQRLSSKELLRVPTVTLLRDITWKTSNYAPVWQITTILFSILYPTPPVQHYKFFDLNLNVTTSLKWVSIHSLPVCRTYKHWLRHSFGDVQQCTKLPKAKAIFNLFFKFCILTENANLLVIYNTNIWLKSLNTLLKYINIHIKRWIIQSY